MKTLTASVRKSGSSPDVPFLWIANSSPELALSAAGELALVLISIPELLIAQKFSAKLKSTGISRKE